MNRRALGLAIACFIVPRGASAYDPARASPLSAEQRPFTLSPGRLTIGVHGGVLFVVSPLYNQHIALWGYRGFGVAPVVSGDAFVSVNRFIWMGVRGGYQRSDGGVARADRADLLFEGGDFGVATRFASTTTDRQRTSVRIVGIEVGAGAEWADLSLRNVHQTAWLPRASAAVFIALHSGVGGVVIRAGYQFVPWSYASPAARLDLSGVFLTLGVEALR